MLLRTEEGTQIISGCVGVSYMLGVACRKNNGPYIRCVATVGCAGCKCV